MLLNEFAESEAVIVTEASVETVNEAEAGAEVDSFEAAIVVAIEAEAEVDLFEAAIEAEAGCLQLVLH